jgi:hypothetical protein
MQCARRLSRSRCVEPGEWVYAPVPTGLGLREGAGKDGARGLFERSCMLGVKNDFADENPVAVRVYAA